MMAVSSNVTKYFFEDDVVPEEDIGKFFCGSKAVVKMAVIASYPVIFARAVIAVEI